jgi:hypothetical protein
MDAVATAHGHWKWRGHHGDIVFYFVISFRNEVTETCSPEPICLYQQVYSFVDALAIEIQLPTAPSATFRELTISMATC